MVAHSKHMFACLFILYHLNLIFNFGFSIFPFLIFHYFGVLLILLILFNRSITLFFYIILFGRDSLENVLLISTSSFFLSPIVLWHSMLPKLLNFIVNQLIIFRFFQVLVI